MINIKINKKYSTNELKLKTYDFSRANWSKFTNILEQAELSEAYLLNDIDKLNDIIVNHINKACEKSIPIKNPNKTFKIKLPQYLVQLIRRKRYLNKIKKHNLVAKKEFYCISRIIGEELDTIKNQNWNSFANSQLDNPLVCKQVWKRINNIKNQNCNLNENYPKLIHNNNEYKTDYEKATIFGSLLSDIFKDDQTDMYDSVFKNQVNNEISDFLQENEVFNSIQVINSSDLDKIIKSLKPTLSSGEDEISNIMIKKLGPNFRKIICHLLNLSIKTGKIPKRWKVAIVKMIPQKNDARNNPNNYRPISLTNCLARVCERALLIKINEQYHRKTAIGF